MSDKNRLIAVEIDEDTLGASGPDAEHELRVAIFDLIEQNSFARSSWSCPRLSGASSSLCATSTARTFTPSSCR